MDKWIYAVRKGKAEDLPADEITNRWLRAIHAQLESGDDFGAVATEVDPITKGDLGWFPRGYLIVPELDDILFTLEIGTYSPVIETALGYHIVQVLDRSLDRPLTAEARRVLQTQALAQWLENERNKSEIIILLP